jgi:hypothetical protein
LKHKVITSSIAEAEAKKLKLNFPTPFKLISKSKDEEFVNDTAAAAP